VIIIIVVGCRLARTGPHGES